MPPETILEILYFEIPKDKLSEEGSLEFYYGCESVKKVSFSASWTKEEIQNKLKEAKAQNFINFLKYKNHQTIFERIEVFLKRCYKNLIKLAKNSKNFFIKEINF